jgi:hypothetical protein
LKSPNHQRLAASPAELKELTMPNRVRTLVLACLLLIVAAIPLAAQSSASLRSGDFIVTYHGYSYDIGANTSTWTYSIAWNGDSPAISHWVLELCGNLKRTDVLATSPAGAIAVGTDPTTGVYGLKFDFGQQVSNQTYSFTLKGLWQEEAGLTVAIKAGTGVSTGLISGPSRNCTTCTPPAASLESQSVCRLTGTASFEVAPTGTGPFSYQWTFDGQPIGGNTSSLNVDSSSLPAGVYPVTVTITGACATANAEATLSVFDIPTASVEAGGATTFCEGGSVVLTAKPDGMQYLWSNGSTSQSITVTASGNYTVRVTNESGCSTNSPARAVVVNDTPDASVEVDGNLTFCDGGSVQLTAKPDGMSYLWSNGSTSQSIIVDASGTFSVTVTSDKGCPAVSDDVVVKENPRPEAAITAEGELEFCEGGSVVLTAKPAGMTYLWSNGETTETITVSASGTFSVTVTNADLCADDSDPVTVTVNPPPVATIEADGPTTFCAGGSVTLTAKPAGMAYLWSNGATAQSITVDASGTYSVTVTNEEGCEDASDSIEVVENPRPEAEIEASGVLEFCEGGSVTLTAKPAGMSYVWSNGETTQSITVTTSGEYTVTVTNPEGCDDVSEPAVVTVNPPPTATIEAAGPTVFCDGGSVTLTAKPDGMTYLWSNGSTDQSITVENSGKYSVVVTNPEGCDDASDEVEVVENPRPEAEVIVDGALEFCEGGSVTLTAKPDGLLYKWSNGSTDQSITVGATGTYSVTVTNEFGCDDASDPVSVKVNPPPDAKIEASGPTTFCDGGLVVLTAKPDGMNYLWSNGSTEQAITVQDDGKFSVTVTSLEGCSAPSAEVEVVVNPVTPVSIEAGGPTTFCEGGSVTLTALPAGLSYLWSTGETTQSITVSDGDVYEVTARNEHGCDASASTSVIVNENPDITLVLPIQTCQLETGLKARIEGAPAGATIEWSILNGQITAGEGTNEIEFTAGPAPQSVAISVKVTSAEGCSTSKSSTVDNLRCDFGCSLTQGAYGSAGGTFHGMTTLSLIQALLGEQPITIGVPGRSLSFGMVDSLCVMDRLPGGGPPATLPSIGDGWMHLPGCQTSPKLPVDKNGKLRNVLLSQTITLALNNRIDDGQLTNVQLCPVFRTQATVHGAEEHELDPGADGVFGPRWDEATQTFVNDDPIETFSIPQSVVTALAANNLPLTPGGIFALASDALGGFNSAPLADITAAVDAINRGFDECRAVIYCANQ